MALTASTIRQEKNLLHGGGGLAIVHGSAAFTTTDLTGQIDCLLTRVHGLRVWALGAPGQATRKVTADVGTLSATGTKQIIVPETGTVTAVKAVVSTTVATHDDNHWTFTCPNKSAADAAVIAATSVNSTDANSDPAGSALTAYTPRSFTLGAGTAVTAGDVLLFTATKAASAANLVDLTLQLELTVGGDVGEVVYFNETMTDGEITPSNGLLNIVRTGPTVTSGLKVMFEYWGF